jgi:hypothetical protein
MKGNAFKIATSSKMLSWMVLPTHIVSSPSSHQHREPFPGCLRVKNLTIVGVFNVLLLFRGQLEQFGPDLVISEVGHATVCECQSISNSSTEGVLAGADLPL